LDCEFSRSETGGRNAHVAQSKLKLELRWHGRAILEVCKIDFGARTGTRGVAGLLSLCQRYATLPEKQCRQQHYESYGCGILERLHGWYLSRLRFDDTASAARRLASQVPELGDALFSKFAAERAIGESGVAG
jgi:hypothetical protein